MTLTYISRPAPTGFEGNSLDDAVRGAFLFSLTSNSYLFSFLSIHPSQSLYLPFSPQFISFSHRPLHRPNLNIPLPKPLHNNRTPLGTLSPRMHATRLPKQTLCNPKRCIPMARSQKLEHPLPKIRNVQPTRKRRHDTFRKR